MDGGAGVVDGIALERTLSLLTMAILLIFASVSVRLRRSRLKNSSSRCTYRVSLSDMVATDEDTKAVKSNEVRGGVWVGFFYFRKSGTKTGAFWFQHGTIQHGIGLRARETKGTQSARRGSLREENTRERERSNKELWWWASWCVVINFSRLVNRPLWRGRAVGGVA